jgi:para-aminobenzoate synthetase/4-amino-4-deoxychorismate lyase
MMALRFKRKPIFDLFKLDFSAGQSGEHTEAVPFTHQRNSKTTRRGCALPVRKSMNRTIESRKLAVTDDHAILLEASSLTPGSRERSFLFRDPIEWLEARDLSELPMFFGKLAAARALGLWSAGYFSYECGYHFEPRAALDFVRNQEDLPLAAFGLYSAPAIFTADPSTSGLALGVESLSLGISSEEFQQKVRIIHSYIESGDTYQVNLTDQVRARYPGSPLELFAHMMEAQPVAFGALFRLGDRFILSASPELFFRVQGRHIIVRPIKGTATRGRDAGEDAARMEALANDEKNRAENVMIADLMRSDLGRVAETGSVRVGRLFAVERLPSLLQMSTEITATLRTDVTLYKLFASLFPSGSIVGAPKVRTMQLIQELEGRPRGVYTGSIGYFAPNGESAFSVAIRTAVLQGQHLHMGVGAGITYDSVAGEEYQECKLKAEFLTDNSFSLIETMRCEAGKCLLLPLHLERLRASADYFGFRFPRTELIDAIESAVRESSDRGASKLRLELRRDGSRTLSELAAIEEESELSRAMLWPEPVQSGDRFLRHKTTRRALYNRATQVSSERGYADAIFHNERGIVTEGAISNIVVKQGDCWLTPPVDAGVLPGVYRTSLLKRMPEIQIVEFSVEQLLGADEVWLTNAVRGMRRVVIES